MGHRTENAICMGARTLAETLSITLGSEEWTDVNSRLMGSTPQAILEWAVGRFPSRLTMATAFGPEGVFDPHAGGDRAKVRVFNLDTGYQFPETLALRDQIASGTGSRSSWSGRTRRWPSTRKQHGGPLYVSQPGPVLLRPQDRAVAAGAGRLRRLDHGDPGRPVGAPGGGERGRWDRKFGLVKINPLLSWTRRDVWAFIVTHNVPYNPLHDQGYPSIGCWPCTRAVAAGEDERAGRWAGQAKTECGLHSLDSSQL